MELKATITTRGRFFESGTPQAIINDNFARAMHEAVMLLERKIKALTSQGVGGAKGGLRSTIAGEVFGKGTPLLKGIVSTQSKYGEVIEKGRTPGKAMPPSGVLLRWLQVKLGMDEQTAKRVEFLVRRKIARRGFPGAHMFEKGFNQSLPQLDEMFGRMGFNVAKELSS